MKFSRLILANLFRKKVRLILTVGSFAIALLLFTFLAVVKSAFSRGTEIAGADRLIVVSRIGLMQLLPISDADKIMAIPGVKAVTHNHWFGGVYQDERNFFPQFVIDPENQRKVMTELVVPDDQWNNFLKDRQGAIAGARTAARFHWKIGDRIPIKQLCTAAALRNSISTAFITATVRAATKASSGCSGNILTRTHQLPLRARPDGTWSSSTTPMTPCASPRPSTKSLPTRRLRPRPRRNPPSLRISPSSSETSNS